jgi:hypothetical protein
MKDYADILIGHMNKLLELAELTRHAAPEDRVRLKRTIELVGRALQTVARVRQQPQNSSGPAAPLCGRNAVS